ncbi:hypothetical protein RB2501_00256 [Robiginitalea biformata HTCC2501]|uniref:Uncharacterized protein n=1 Tax=Robiginitalea biformata (strain ATCC BAA-864 / DSM 15991 / KCTC 12146 / HTCC2501) TaxID=313596 RepID=A4CNJ4_ROBBH|nr:hypothetical protein RB2501_00256 [Robiginitalea biformata HTCC2501]
MFDFPNYVLYSQVTANRFLFSKRRLNTLLVASVHRISHRLSGQGNHPPIELFSMFNVKKAGFRMAPRVLRAGSLKQPL